MSNRQWFRFYHDALDDPKVQRLPGGRFKAWVNLLCLASRNDGKIDKRNVSFALRLSDEEAEFLISDFTSRECELLDWIDETFLEPHNWPARQYKSDVSTDRVHRFREKKRNVSSNVSEGQKETQTEKVVETRDETFHETTSETPPEQSRTDTEQINNSLRSSVGRKRRDPAGGDDFERFWAAYPKRTGANPKHPAGKLFAAAVKGGADPQAIITGATMYADELRRTGKLGSEHVAQAKTWLSQQRWKDYPEQLEAGIDQPKAAGYYAKFGSPQLAAWDQHRRAVEGRSFPRDAKGGWTFPSEWPPGFVAPAADCEIVSESDGDRAEPETTHHAPTVGDPQSRNAALLAELAEI